MVGQLSATPPPPAPLPPETARQSELLHMQSLLDVCIQDLVHLTGYKGDQRNIPGLNNGGLQPGNGPANEHLDPVLAEKGHPGHGFRGQGHIGHPCAPAVGHLDQADPGGGFKDRGYSGTPNGQGHFGHGLSPFKFIMHQVCQNRQDCQTRSASTGHVAARIMMACVSFLAEHCDPVCSEA